MSLKKEKFWLSVLGTFFSLAFLIDALVIGGFLFQVYLPHVATDGTVYVAGPAMPPMPPPEYNPYVPTPTLTPEMPTPWPTSAPTEIPTIFPTDAPTEVLPL